MFWGLFCCFVLNVLRLFHQTFQHQGNVGAISLEYQITQNSVSCLLMASKQSVASVQCLFSLFLTQQLLLSPKFIFLSLFKPFSSLLSFLFSFNILLPVINHFSSCPFPLPCPIQPKTVNSHPGDLSPCFVNVLNLLICFSLFHYKNKEINNW